MWGRRQSGWKSERGRGTERALIFGEERFAEVFNRSDGAGLEMRLPGTVRATGVGPQLQGGASGVCETCGSHRAVPEGLGKRLAGISATQRATQIASAGF